MAQLTERDHHDEDAADGEHDEDGLLAFLGGRLDGKQVREHARNLPQRHVRRERLVDRCIAGRLTRRRLERGRVAVEPKGGTRVVEPA